MATINNNWEKNKCSKYHRMQANLYEFFSMCTVRTVPLREAVKVLLLFFDIVRSLEHNVSVYCMCTFARTISYFSLSLVSFV